MTGHKSCEQTMIKEDTDRLIVMASYDKFEVDRYKAAEPIAGRKTSINVRKNGPSSIN